MIIQRFPYGQYIGKSFAQVALSDPDYFLWLLEKKESGRQNDFVYRNLKEHYDKLNDFIPKVKCKYYQGCDKTAEVITIYTAHDPIKGTAIDISASPSYAWCKEHQDSHGYPKAAPFPIKFEIVKRFPKFPKWIRKDVADVVFQCAGFSGSKTEKNCVDFFNSLTRKDCPVKKDIEHIVKEDPQGELF